MYLSMRIDLCFLFISFELNQERIGNTYKVLFDRVEGDYFIGRTEFDSPDVDMKDEQPSEECEKETSTEKENEGMP